MRCSVRPLVTVAVLSCIVVPSVAIACLWDYDTIKMERTRFPNTLELITGKFLRHSPEFYQWRIQDRLKRLESDPTNVALLDDLAVAYDKTGQHSLAIQTAQKTEKLKQGRYETAANLGTFYIHAGRPSEGLPHIERALTINPDAHFGREKYQKLLVEYVLSRSKGGSLNLPLAEVTIYPQTTESSAAPSATVGATFKDFLRTDNQAFNSVEIASAVKGVLGMMKFGKFDSPVLLEALGSLLVEHDANPEQDAKLLAARAFLKASYEVPDGPTRVAYRGMARNALEFQSVQRDKSGQISLEKVEADFKLELEDAKAWYADLRENELAWIREGKDPEVEFDRLYTTEPELPGLDVQDPPTVEEIGFRRRIIVFVVFSILGVAFVATVGYVIRRVRHRAAA